MRIGKINEQDPNVLIHFVLALLPYSLLITADELEMFHDAHWAMTPGRWSSWGPESPLGKKERCSGVSGGSSPEADLVGDLLTCVHRAKKSAWAGFAGQASLVKQ